MGLVTGFLCISSLSVIGNQSIEVNEFRQTLVVLPLAELPSKSADLVKQASLKDREATTKKVVKATFDISPAAAPKIVAAIGQSIPEMASVAAATASELQPRQAAALARAAASAAPSMAGKIVQMVCGSVPGDYKDIAVNVAQVAPASGKEILDAVSEALPEMKAAINVSVLSYAGNITSVADVLEQAKSIARIAPIAKISTPSLIVVSNGSPAVPPYIQLSATPANVFPKNDGAVPFGGRAQVDP